jgi:hypothetical protein
LAFGFDFGFGFGFGVAFVLASFFSLVFGGREVFLSTAGLATRAFFFTAVFSFELGAIGKSAREVETAPSFTSPSG